jgi:hypothetical protein
MGSYFSDYICHGIQTWVVDLGRKQEWISFISFFLSPTAYLEKGILFPSEKYFDKSCVAFQ